MTEPNRRDDKTGWENSLYDQLHRIAQDALAKETPGHSLQPTLLVNDAYLRLLEQNNLDPADRLRMMAAGANIIRRLLVDYARTRKAEKRGGPAGRGHCGNRQSPTGTRSGNDNPVRRRAESGVGIYC